MRREPLVRFLTAVSVLSAVPALTQDSIQIVPRGSETRAIHRSQLDAGAWTSYGPPDVMAPSRGAVTAAADGLVYDPDPEFWDVGFDSFAYTYPSYTEAAIVYLVADLKEFPLAGPALAGCQLDEDWTFGGDLGQLALVPSNDGDPSPCRLQITLGAASTSYVSLRGGGGPGGGNTSFTLDTGGNGTPGDVAVPPGGPNHPIPVPLAILQAKTGTGQVVFEVQQVGIAGAVIRTYASNGEVVTSPTAPLPAAAVIPMELTWWFSSQPGAKDGGAFLTVEGQLAAEISGIDNHDFRDEELDWDCGSLSVSTGWSGKLGFENIQVWTSGRQPAFRPLGADNAEDGGQGGWDGASGLGQDGIQVTAGPDREYFVPFARSKDPATLERLIPNPSAHLAIAFELDVAGVQASPGERWTVARTRTGGAGGAVPFRITVRRNLQGDGYDVRLGGASSSRGATSPWVPLPAASSRWRMVTKFLVAEPGSGSTGGVQLWVDGADWLSLPQLANEAAMATALELGVMDQDPGITGALLLDDFFAWH